MSNGGYKGATPPRETSPEQYPGVWELTEQFQAQADGNWPFQETDCAPQSLRFESANTSTLSRTPSATGNRRTWTMSFWIKLLGGGSSGVNPVLEGGFSGSGGSQGGFGIKFDSNEKLQIVEQNSNSITWRLITDAVFRDYTAWYHFVVELDTTRSTEADRVKLWVNGDQVTSFSTASYPSLNYQSNVNRALPHRIGASDGGGSPYLPMDAYLADVHFIDGQALSCDEFGFFDGQGIWQPKRFTGDYSSGPVYSNFLTGGIDSSYPASNGFDGVTSGVGVRTSANGTMVWQPTSPIGFNNSFKIYCSLDGNSYGNTFTVTHAGGTTDFTSSVATGTTNTAVDLALISGVTSPITKITVASGGSNPRFSAIEQDGQLLTDASVGRNSFHLDFSDGVKDQSGVGNDWSATNLTFSGTTVAESRIWESGDTEWSIAAGGANATKTSNGSYADVFTGKFEVGKLYAFTSTFPTADNNGGWFFADSNSTSLSGTHPNQGRGSNSIGIRGNNSTLGVHGTFATANGNSAISGFGDSDPYNGVTLNWVVDRVNHKVWVKTASGSSWIKGGNPTDPTSTASFLIPSSGDIYFGVIQYDGISNLNLASYSLSQTITTGDNSVDSPVNGNELSTGAGGERRGNYPTFNKLAFNPTLTQGNSTVVDSGGWNTWYATVKTPSSGKWYYEVTATGSNVIPGIASDIPRTQSYISALTDVTSYGWYLTGSFLGPGYSGSVGSWSTGDVVGVAIDLDNNTLQFYRNGSTIGGAYNIDPNSYYPAVSTYSASATINFGALPLKYPAPSGFSLLATSFLPEPAIKDPSTAFKAVLYSGNGSSQTISGLRFSPDLVWVKSRSTAVDHILFDSVRGFGANKELTPNDNYAEGATGSGQPNTDVWGYVESVTSDGFVVNKGSNANGSVANTSGSNYVAWAWDAGSSTVTNTDGSVSSQVRASQTAGCSIVTWTGSSAGQTVGHGLNAAPEMIIVKARDQSQPWVVYHSALGKGGVLQLHSTAANITTYSQYWGANEPSSTVFGTYTGAYPWANNYGNMVALCFAPVAGYSAFGSYTGKSGPNFQYLGFQPRWIMIKNYSTNSYSAYTGWAIFDTSRKPFNVNVEALWANKTSDEGKRGNGSSASAPDFGIDILSNGFCLRDNGASEINLNSQTYLYAAFAEHPFASQARAR